MSDTKILYKGSHPSKYQITKMMDFEESNIRSRLDGDAIEFLFRDTNTVVRMPVEKMKSMMLATIESYLFLGKKEGNVNYLLEIETTQ